MGAISLHSEPIDDEEESELLEIGDDIGYLNPTRNKMQRTLLQDQRLACELDTKSEHVDDMEDFESDTASECDDMEQNELNANDGGYASGTFVRC